VDKVHEHRAWACTGCDADLSDAKALGSYRSHYVSQIPEIQPIVHEHRCLDVQCPICGRVVPASLPLGVPKGQYDPSVQAMTGLLRGELKQSVRQTSAVLTQVLHVPMSTGMVSKTQQQVSGALAAPCEQALAHAQAQDRANADETSWRQEKKKAGLWVAVAGLVTVFLIRASRGAKVAKELLGESFQGILTTDRWAAYNWVASKLRQLCWSHLKRDFKSFLDYGPEAKSLGEQLLC
jgi:transposase